MCLSPSPAHLRAGGDVWEAISVHAESTVFYLVSVFCTAFSTLPQYNVPPGNEKSNVRSSNSHPFISSSTAEHVLINLETTLQTCLAILSQFFFKLIALLRYMCASVNHEFMPFFRVSSQPRTSRSFRISIPTSQTCPRNSSVLLLTLVLTPLQRRLSSAI